MFSTDDESLDWDDIVSECDHAPYGCDDDECSCVCDECVR